MKTLILSWLSIIFFAQCSPQVNKETKPLAENSHFQSTQSLVGKWYKTDYYIETNGNKKNLMDACAAKSLWDISLEKNTLELKKISYSGVNCAIQNIQSFKNVSLLDGSLNYKDLDIIKSDKLEKLTEKSYRIIETTLVQGATAKIVTVFTKK